MKAHSRLILFALLTAFGALLPGLLAQAPLSETPPPAPVVEPAIPVATAEPASAPGEFRRLDTVEPEVEAAEAPAAPKVQEPKSPAKKKRLTAAERRARGNGGDEQVSLHHDIHIEAGRVNQDGLVGLLANVLIDGEVKDDVVAVLGNVTVNGTVEGEIVAVMGDVTLGPDAHVGGQIVCVGGRLIRDPGAYVGGQIFHSAGKVKIGEGFDAWLHKAARYGRPLAMGAHLGWLWLTTVAIIAFYALMALLWPRQIKNCGDLLVQRPLAVVATAILTMLALPFLFILLMVTGVGIPIAILVLPIGLLLCLLFGKAAIYALVGRALSGERLIPVLAVIVGAIPFLLIYLVPFVGFAMSLLVSTLGFGCSMVAIFSSRRKAPPDRAPVAPQAQPPAAAAVMSVNVDEPVSPVAPSRVSPAVSGLVADEPPAVAPAPEPVLPPPVMTLPPVPPVVTSAVRAGFWIRMGALMIDLILVGAVCGPLGMGQITMVALAIYGAVLWKYRSTTIGGIVCGLQVVRLDGRAVDWPTAVVRALSCFLSLIVGGLGFVWVVFDPEKQSWHDKIAGTVVVRAPRGTSLV